MKSIHHLNIETLSGLSNFISSLFNDDGKPVIMTSGLNDVDNLEDDFRRILELNKNKPGRDGRQALPVLVMSLSSLKDTPLQNVPRDRKFIAFQDIKSPDPKEVNYRLVECEYSARVYFTTAYQAMDLLETLVLFEDTNFIHEYTIDWLPGHIFKVNLHIVDFPQVKKESRLDEKGQIFSLRFNVHARGLLVSPLRDAKIVLKVEPKILDWTNQTSLATFA